MLRIRFSRTGKTGQPSFRIVVAEHSSPVKNGCVELLGNYLPARNPKEVTLKKDRILYWISKGAIPTDTAATLFKKEGMEGMDKYMEPRNKKRKKKGEEAAAEPAKESGPKKEESAAENKPA